MLVCSFAFVDNLRIMPIRIAASKQKGSDKKPLYMASICHDFLVPNLGTQNIILNDVEMQLIIQYNLMLSS